MMMRHWMHRITRQNAMFSECASVKPCVLSRAFRSGSPGNQDAMRRAMGDAPIAALRAGLGCPSAHRIATDAAATTPKAKMRCILQASRTPRVARVSAMACRSSQRLPDPS